MDNDMYDRYELLLSDIIYYEAENSQNFYLEQEKLINI